MDILLLINYLRMIWVNIDLEIMLPKIFILFII